MRGALKLLTHISQVIVHYPADIEFIIDHPLKLPNEGTVEEEVGSTFSIIFAANAFVWEMKSPLDQVVLGQNFVEKGSPPEEIDLEEELGVPDLFLDKGDNRFPL
ncbi:hypothetical protein SUGI_1079280 [Cryptomeria japonica]|nr:hypothetical protein SUGI_1079280 [Cryptomeria japonica]